MSNNSVKVRKMAMLAMFAALLVIMTWVPMVGFIQIPPLVSITTMHIPVIIGAILLGPTAGGILGFVFGLMSMLKATFAGAGIGDWIFSPFMSNDPIASIIMCFIPRILLGIVAGWLFLLLSKGLKNETARLGITAAVSAIFHTISVLGLMGLLFQEESAIRSLKQVLAIAFAANGLLELAVTIVLTIAVAKPILVISRKKRG